MTQFKDKNFTPDMSILDDVAKIAGGAVNVLSGVKQQIEYDMQARVDEIATRLDLVPREDLDTAKEQIKTLYDRIESLEKRLDSLEKKK